jgi:hypothetical protein
VWTTLLILIVSSKEIGNEVVDLVLALVAVAVEAGRTGEGEEVN